MQDSCLALNWSETGILDARCSLLPHWSVSTFISYYIPHLDIEAPRKYIYIYMYIHTCRIHLHRHIDMDMDMAMAMDMDTDSYVSS